MLEWERLLALWLECKLLLLRRGVPMMLVELWLVTIARWGWTCWTSGASTDGVAGDNVNEGLS